MRKQGAVCGKTLKSLKEQGLTIFLTSHFMDEVEALCDEICILKKGTPVFRGTVEQAKQQCGCEHFEDAYLQLSDEERWTHETLFYIS